MRASTFASAFGEGQAQVRLRRPFVVVDDSAQTGRPSDGVFDHPALRRRHEPMLGPRRAHHGRPDAVLRRCLGGIAGVPQVTECEPDGQAGSGRHGGRRVDLDPFPLAGWGAAVHEQVAEGVACGVDLGAARPLESAVARPLAARRRRLRRPSVLDHRRRRRVAPVRLARPGAPVVRHRLEAAGRGPAPGRGGRSLGTGVPGDAEGLSDYPAEGRGGDPAELLADAERIAAWRSLSSANGRKSWR